MDEKPSVFKVHKFDSFSDYDIMTDKYFKQYLNQPLRSAIMHPGDLTMMHGTNNQMIKNYITDIFINFLYYDRKGDKEFTPEIAQTIPSYITKEDMIAEFTRHINKIYGG